MLCLCFLATITEAIGWISQIGLRRAGEKDPSLCVSAAGLVLHQTLCYCLSATMTKAISQVLSMEWGGR
ncbi:hypothetical protein NMG60_11003116 [Bertholletia excelsa]